MLSDTKYQIAVSAVRSMVGEKYADRWWESYNLAFQKTPAEQWVIDPEVVYNYLLSYLAR